MLLFIYFSLFVSIRIFETPRYIRILVQLTTAKGYVRFGALNECPKRGMGTAAQGIPIGL